MSRLIVDAPFGFRLPVTVESHGWYRLAPFGWNAGREMLSRPERVDSGAVVRLQVSQSGDELNIDWKPGRAATGEEIRRRVGRMLQLHLDLTGFHRRAARRRSHRDAAAIHFGRLLCGTSRFEDAVRIITTTNTAWRQTIRMNQLLVAHFGARGSAGAAFPSAHEIAAATPADLQEKCRLGYRAATIHRLACGVVDGTFPIEQDTSRMSTSELDDFFQSFPGIGPYGSAHLLAMEGRHEWIAVDTEFRRYVRTRYFSGADPGDAEMVAVYRSWGQWKYLAYWWELWSEVRDSVAEIRE